MIRNFIKHIIQELWIYDSVNYFISDVGLKNGSRRQGERWWRQVTHGGCGYGYYYKSTLVTFVTFATVWIISWKAELTIQWLKEKN